MEPLVDIVLATYNGALYLEAQLASLSAQTHRNWRLIARDDGSTDTTAAILAKFAAEDDRVVILPTGGGSGSGPVAAFSEALAHSDAPYFMFCDQDDVWLPEKTTVLLDALRVIEGGGAPCIAHSDMRVVDENLSEIAPSFWERLNLNPTSATAKTLLMYNVVTGCAMIGNASLRDAITPIPETVIMHDWWAAAVAAHKGKIVSVAQPTLLYRRHSANVTGLAEQTGFWHGLRELFKPGGSDVSKSRAHLADLQRQARALAPIVGGGAAAEFGNLPTSGLLRRKTFLLRHGLIRWEAPIWSAAYHWII